MLQIPMINNIDTKSSTFDDIIFKNFSLLNL